MTGSSSWITKNRRLAIYIRDGFSCCYCAKDLREVSPREMGLDHLENLVSGGGHKGANHKSDNLVTVCRSCNSSRQAAPYAEFAARFPGSLARVDAQRRAFVNTDLAKSIINGGENADR